MEQITLRVQENTKESLQEEADEADKSLSEHIRTLIRNRHEDAGDDERVQDLQQRLEELRSEREELLQDSVRVEFLQDELERVREERDEAIRRAERNEARLAVHSSEQDLMTRLK